MATAVESSRNAAYTNQCIAPTQCHWSIRVCSNDSLSSVTVRLPGFSERLAGCPRRTVPRICCTARAVMTTATAVKARDTTMAKVCMDLLVSQHPPRGRQVLA